MGLLPRTSFCFFGYGRIKLRSPSPTSYADGVYTFLNDFFNGPYYDAIGHLGKILRSVSLGLRVVHHVYVYLSRFDPYTCVYFVSILSLFEL